MASGSQRTQPQFTGWHECFYVSMTERAPPGFDLVAELLLSLRPRRADLLLLRRSGEPRRDEEARLLRGLWPRLGKATLIELKSAARGFRRSEFLRLCGYGLQYHEHNLDELPHASELTLVLVMASLNQAFTDELALLRCSLQPLGGGYAEVVGFPYGIYVVCTDEVAETEDDDFLRIHSHHKLKTEEARLFLETFILRKRSEMPDITEREDYQEMLGKLLSSLPAEQRLAGLPAEEVLSFYEPEEVLSLYDPEERLAGLDPEERLAGLDPAEVLSRYNLETMLPLLPVELLRSLPEDFLRTLPEDVQQAVRRRLAGSR
jgi:hypothetical protein